MLIGLSVLGAKKLVAEGRMGHLWLLLCWGVVPVPFLFLLLWIKDYFFAIRQFLFLTPAMLILAALGILSLAERLGRTDERRRTRAVAWLTLAVAAVSLLVIGLHVPDHREDLRGAGQFLKQNVQPEDVVVAPEISGVLAYYFPEINRHLLPPSELDGFAGDASRRSVFVVETAYMSTVSRRLVEAVLGKALSRRQIALRNVEIVEIARRR